MVSKILFYIVLLQSVNKIFPFVVRAPKLPSYFKVCHQSDVNLGKCIKNSVEELRPLLIRGIPDLGIPSMEPLSIPEVILDQGSGPVALRSIYKNIKVYGPSKFVIRDIKIDLEKDKMKIRLFIPHLQVECNYRLDGKIMMMPISGSGLSISNYTNIDATVTLRIERVNKNNNIYYNVKDLYINFDIAEAKIHFDNLFNGDKDLGEAMNVFLNDNWKQIGNEIKPVLEDNIAIIFKKFANKIFHKYPRNVLLPQ